MKNFPQSGLLAAVAFTALIGLSPSLRAQDAPPMDQGDQGPPPNQDAPYPNSSPDQGGPDQGDQGDVSFQTFYDQLSPEGTWMQTDNYGYVWQPDVQDPDWRPYSDGHWIYTDDGWTWAADASEPWGWATYHYGRWANLNGVGWVWVPGYTWAPAWVSWRYGGGYCGWAPLPPETSVGIDFGGGDNEGFHIGGDCDTAYDIGPGYYNFVPVIYIGAGDYRPYYVNRYNNYTVINNTRNMTSITVNGTTGGNRFGHVTTGGPSFTTVNAQSRTPVQRASLVSSSRVGNASLQGNQLNVYAPQVRAATTARPQNVASNLSTASVNRGTSISQPLAVSSRIAPLAPSAQQVQAAQTAQRKIPRNAKIATTSTQLARPLTAPLTALQPHSVAGTSAATNTAVHPAVKSVPASQASVDRGENAFTGGTSSTGIIHHHHQSQNGGTTSGQTTVSHDNASTSVQHTPPFVRPHVNAEPTPHFSAPVEHQAAPPSQPAFHPAAASQPAYHPAMVQHTSVQPAAPVHQAGSAPHTPTGAAPHNGPAKPAKPGDPNDPNRQP
jgi:hypothetical protein